MNSEIISENVLIIHDSLELSISLREFIRNKTTAFQRQDYPGDRSVPLAHIFPSGWGFTRSLSLLDVTQKIIQ